MERAPLKCVRLSFAVSLAMVAACGDAAFVVAPPSDAAADATSHDAAREDGSDNDAADGADGGTASRGCKALPPALFCDDFDVGQVRVGGDAGPSWTSGHTRLGSYGVDTTQFVSPGYSFFASTTSVDTGDFAQAFVRKTFAPRTITDAALDLQVRLPAACGEAVVGTIRFESAGEHYELQIQLKATGISVNEITSAPAKPETYVAHASPAIFPTGQWVRFRLELHVTSSSAGTVTLVQDSATVLVTAVDLAYLDGAIATSAGIAYVGGKTGSCAAYFDNLWFDLK
ncbi:MAG: hypothetical protein JWM74_105 [Myxococcaceae bacterium]|nr:hypothetical protein [Myxococcaceae bacterium]